MFPGVFPSFSVITQTDLHSKPGQYYIFYIYCSDSFTFPHIVELTGPTPSNTPVGFSLGYCSYSQYADTLSVLYRVSLIVSRWTHWTSPHLWVIVVTRPAHVPLCGFCSSVVTSQAAQHMFIYYTVTAWSEHFSCLLWPRSQAAQDYFLVW